MRRRPPRIRVTLLHAASRWLWVALCLGGTWGCQLVVDFDRSAIVDAAADVPDAGDGSPSEDAGTDATMVRDAASDANDAEAPPLDGTTDGGDDGGPGAPDVGMADGGDDGGTDAADGGPVDGA